MSTKMSTETYDALKMERLKHYLESNAERDKPRYFEIYVDNLKAVDKTNDPAGFDDYTMYMTEDTRMVRVLIYSTSETSPRNDKFIFTIKDPKAERELLQKQELSGLEVQEKITSAITLERDRIELERLREQLAEKTKLLEEAELYHEQLEEEITKLRSPKSGLKEIRFGQIASVAIEETLKRNPSWMQKVPLLGTLSGLLSDGEEHSPAEQPGDNDTAGSASFTKAKSDGIGSAFSDADKNRLHFMKSMESFFTEPQYERVIEIIQGLAANTEHVETVHQLLYPAKNS